MPNARAGSSIVRHMEAEGAATLNRNTMRKNSCLKLAKWKTILYLSFSEPQQVWNKADKTELYWQAHSRSTPGKSRNRRCKVLLHFSDYGVNQALCLLAWGSKPSKRLPTYQLLLSPVAEILVRWLAVPTSHRQ